jgi:hypothetical protein
VTLPLININIPDDDGWQDRLSSRVLALALAAVLMRVGLRLWGAAVDGGLVAAMLTALTFAAGVQIAVLCACDINMEQYSRKIAYGVVAVMTLLALGLAWTSNIFPRLGSDVIAFSSYAAELVANGQNPFAMSMGPSADLPGHPDQWTLRADGSRVTAWSYPGGSLWLYGAQYLAIGRGPIGIRLTSIIGVTVLGVAMIEWLPTPYQIAGPLSLIAAQNEWLAAAGGLNDMWWVLPTAGSLVLWARDRRVAAAVVLGIACAMKQQPWPIAGFLAIWVWKERDSVKDFARTGGTYAAAGLGMFLVLNLPWMLAGPGAWLGSVLVPISTASSPLISTGVGVAVLNTAVDGTVPYAVFGLLLPAVIVASLAAYWAWFETLRWAAWVSPAVILFFSSRSLPSYFHWILPLALLALFARYSQLPGQQEVAA